MSRYVRTSGGLQDFRVAQSLVLDSRHLVNVSVRWQFAPPAKKVCVLPVIGAPEGTRIEMEVGEFKLSEPKVKFIHPDGWIRRLCVNSNHDEIRGTHKHHIVNGDLESAYEPNDIPSLPLSRHVRTGVHREILEAFLGECNIGLGPNYRWAEPYPNQEK